MFKHKNVMANKKEKGKERKVIPLKIVNFA